MIYDTPEKMQRRRDQIENSKIQSLYKKYVKSGYSKLYLWVAQKYHGLDCDYIPGFDDGSERPETHYEVIEDKELIY